MHAETIRYAVGPRGLPRLAAVVGVALLGAPRPALALDDANLRAVLFQRERAESLNAPLVLLCHETRCEMQGNGRRVISEDWVWFVKDPDSEAGRSLRHPRILLETPTESFGLNQCRVFRDRDTLAVEPGSWRLGVPEGWPCADARAWAEAGAPLPELKCGDVVQISYTIHNRWERGRVPSDWQVLPLRQPGVPILDRAIQVPSIALLGGRVKLIGDSTRLVRHWGEMDPLIELHTGNLPPGEGDPTTLGSPRLLFTAHADWESVRRTLNLSFGPSLLASEQELLAAGDSLARAFPSTAARLGGVLDFVEQRWRRVPRSLTSGTYYPQPPRVLLATGCADRLDRALLVAALAGAARLKLDVFLARPAGGEPFVPDICTPHQFDRVLLRARVIEEDRSILLDPWEPTLAAARAAVFPGMLLLGIGDDVQGIHEVTDEGNLRPRPLP